jgi:DNA helicase-2/ATP-dependent DNA helicase PcrA
LESLRRNIDDFQPTVKETLKRNKLRLLENGFATYQDAEFLCYKVLCQFPRIAANLYQRFPIIMIDECQDLSYSQLVILYKLQAYGTKLHFVGDVKQSIYEFKKVDPARVISFVDKFKFIKKTLTNNYRSNQKIVDFCSRLAGVDYHVTGLEPDRIHNSCILWQYSDDNFVLLPERFRDLVIQSGLNLAQCCVLVRGRSLLARPRPQKTILTTPSELFASALMWWNSEHSKESLESALYGVGKSICYLAYGGRGNHQSQYCPEGVKPHEWRAFLVGILNGAGPLYPFLDENEQKLCWREWVAILKDHLAGVWDQLPAQKAEWQDINSKVRSPSGKAREEIEETISLARTTASDLRITTIHDVKGETFEAVLLISSATRRGGKGGHFEEWLTPRPGNEEHQRFAYVASSRPKHLLVIATPNLDTAQLYGFKNLGMSYEPFN